MTNPCYCPNCGAPWLIGSVCQYCGPTIDPVKTIIAPQTQKEATEEKSPANTELDNTAGSVSTVIMLLSIAILYAVITRNNLLTLLISVPLIALSSVEICLYAYLKKNQFLGLQIPILFIALTLGLANFIIMLR